MHVMDKLDMGAQAKNHAEPKNIRKQEELYSELIYFRNEIRLYLYSN
jgi:hypothetical protein